MTVLPVTWIVSGRIPSARRFDFAHSVGGKWCDVIRVVSCRFISSGHGFIGSQVRRPASTCPTGIFR